MSINEPMIKVSVLFSLLFTSTFATVVLTNHYDYISISYEFLAGLKEILRGLSIKAHNYLYNDDLWP